MTIRRFMHRNRKDEDLAEEIESHLAHEQDVQTERGLPPQEARRQARLRFGNPHATRERVWRYRSFPLIEDVWRDLRFALRSLARTPGFTSIAILVIAVGIGVNTAVFSVINAVLLKPLTYPDPQALVQMGNTSSHGAFPVANIPKFNIWRQQTGIFQQVAAYDLGGAGMNITGGDHPEQVQGISCLRGILCAVRRSRRCRTHIHRRGRQPTRRSRYRAELRSVEEALWRRPQDRRLHHSTGWPALSCCRRHRPRLCDRYARRSVGAFQFDLTSREMVHDFTVAARLKPGITPAQANAQLAAGRGSVPPHLWQRTHATRRRLRSRVAAGDP